MALRTSDLYDTLTLLEDHNKHITVKTPLHARYYCDLE